MKKFIFALLLAVFSTNAFAGVDNCNVVFDKAADDLINMGIAMGMPQPSAEERAQIKSQFANGELCTCIHSKLNDSPDFTKVENVWMARWFPRIMLGQQPAQWQIQQFMNTLDNPANYQTYYMSFAACTMK